VRFDVPPAIAERVREAAAGPAREPATPRDAATVVLLRDAPGGGVETYVLHRVAAMAAFGGLTVFPGGSVDPADSTTDDVPWAGPGSQWWSAPMSAPPPLARALVCAAVRETFEESGVLLAGPDDRSVVADTSGPDWEQARRALEGHEISLSALLADRGLVLRADLLRPWAHWITPVLEARRFDTRFLVAALPEGQVTRDVSTEAERAGWARPADLLAARERGEVQMVPPTALTLATLAKADSVAEVLDAAARLEIRPVTPELLVEPDGRVGFHLPDHAIHGHRQGHAQGHTRGHTQGHTQGGRP
jgi:8-oxo-dGTP pyrophosphatase MutT (NUDIX family)